MKLGDLDKFSMLIGAICHDLKHTGQNNIFHINTRSKIAMKYKCYVSNGSSDQEVLNDFLYNLLNIDNYYILDYKTGSAPKNAKYDFQTIIYILAVKEFFKTEKVTFVYIDLKNRSLTLVVINDI